jgi:hypothetical protein
MNAGCRVTTIQKLLGHQRLNSTMIYARLYDGTVAADDYRAMAEIESRFEGGENAGTPPDSAQLPALVDAPDTGTLSDAQWETVHALRADILATFASLPSATPGTGSAGLAKSGNYFVLTANSVEPSLFRA